MLITGIDCTQEFGELATDGCCPPPICQLDPCKIVCNFINLLPRGPLWDRPKNEALYRYQTDCNGGSPCLPTDTGCATMVDVAIYKAKNLYDLLVNSVAPSIAESSPYTAYDTLDDWLVRLGWVDCFASTCRDMSLSNFVTGGLTPVEVPGECGPVFCLSAAPSALSIATKHGLAIALQRLNMGIIKNLCSINFVISSLGAKLSYTVPACEPGGMVSDGTVSYSISPLSNTLPKWLRPVCPPTEEYLSEKGSLISANYVTDNCGVVTPLRTIWPGLLAAECIVRSLITNDGSIEIIRDY